MINHTKQKHALKYSIIIVYYSKDVCNVMCYVECTRHKKFTKTTDTAIIYPELAFYYLNNY